MGKASKATKKFAASGKLKKVIEARHKRQQVQKKIQRRKGQRIAQSERPVSEDSGGKVEEKEEGPLNSRKSTKGMSVDDFLNGNFMDGSDLEGNVNDEDSEAEDIDEEEDFDDDASFAFIDDLGEDGKNHLEELSKLAEKDPEFYKYLQENDRELLEFDPDAMAAAGLDEEDMEDEDMDGDNTKLPVLTLRQIQQWQKALLKHKSLRAFRRLLIAFRAAVHMNEEDQVLAWSIDNSAVYNKLLVVSLRYAPVVLQHHVPYKILANGKFKAPTQTEKFKILRKLVLSFFYNILHIISQLSDSDLVQLAVTESAKLIPYVISSRKAVKLYLKICLDLWSDSEDAVRMAAFLSIRKLASAQDDSIMDTILKSTYQALVRSSKSTSAHILPSLNLMKNSASEVFCLDHSASYQHAFGYIRQLAIHLRNSMKVKTKEAYKQVYNWQYIHCIDFWCLVLARACDVKAEAAASKESELRPLIYPLVQVSLGSIKLVPHSRSYPFHLHVIRSLLHLTKHTETYIPIAPYLLPIVSSALSPSTRPRSSTLKPLDLEVQIRVPQQYLKTRVCYEGITEESVYYLAEWLASPAVHGSIAFPEIAVPIIVVLRKDIKNAPNGTTKEQGMVKNLLERVEDSARWIEHKRKGVIFAPGKIAEVKRWEEDLRSSLDDAPLRRFLKVQRKARDKRRQLVQKAREGKDEILED